MVWEQRWSLTCCRRRNVFSDQGPRNTCSCPHWPFRGFRSFRGVRGPNAHHVTHVNDTTYAVVDPTGDSASGRVVPDILFGEKVARSTTFSPKRLKLNHLFPKKLLIEQLFWEKIKNVPRCRRRIRPFIQTNTWFGTYRVRRVNDRTYAVTAAAGRH